MKSDLEQRSVGSLVRENEKRAIVFERFGIDYCCHGDAPLEDACARAEVRLNEVLNALEAIEESVSDNEGSELSTMPLSLLIDDIVKRHHVYLREQLPVLGRMIDRVVNAHGKHHRELCALCEVFASLRNELTSHMMKEERVLFPIIVELERAVALEQAAPQFHCGSVAHPINAMESEHESAGDALSLIRRLTNDYRIPRDSCSTYRALLAGLHALEADLHLHIHKENNILFPRAILLEDRLVEADANRVVVH